MGREGRKYYCTYLFIHYSSETMNYSTKLMTVDKYEFVIVILNMEYIEFISVYTNITCWIFKTK